MAEEPNVKVCTLGFSGGGGIPVCCADHRESLDIHGKNSQQCEAPQYIDAVDALFLNQGLRELAFVQIHAQSAFENCGASHSISPGRKLDNALAAETSIVKTEIAEATAI